MTVLLANNVSSALAAPITASATSMTVTDGSRFPVLSAGQYFYATIIATNGIVEIVKVNTRNGNAMSITRAQDGTNAQTFPSGARVEMRINAASVRDTVTDQTGPLDTRLTTAEGDITALEGRMTTAEGDITSLEGRMTTAEGDIVALEAFDTALATSTGSASVGFLQAGTGASLRTVQSKLRDYVSVKDFGAVGDGITNDTTAFNNAIATGSRVYVPEGTYLCNATINTKTIIFGDGSLASIVKPYNPAIAVFTYTIVAQQNPIYRFWDYHSEVRNLGFFSASAKTGVGFTFARTAPADYQLNDEFANNVKFYGCYFEGFEKALQFPFGNIGTEIYSCGFALNKYGIYTLNNKFGAAMHCGNKYMFGGEFHGNEAAVYANDDPQALIFNDVIFEFNQIAYYGYASGTIGVNPVAFNDCWFEGNGTANNEPSTTVVLDAWAGTVKTTVTVDRHAVYLAGSRGQIVFNRCFVTDVYVGSTNTVVYANNCRVENDAANGGGPGIVVNPDTSSIVMTDCYTAYGFMRSNGCEVAGRPSLGFYPIDAAPVNSSSRWFLTAARTAKSIAPSNLASGVNFTVPVSTGNGSFSLTGTVVEDGRIFATCNEFTRASFLSSEFTAVNSPTSFFTTTAGWYVYSFDAKRISGDLQINVWDRGPAQFAVNIRLPALNRWYTVSGIGYSPSPQTMYLDFQGADQTVTWRMSAWQCLRFDTLADAQSYIASLGYADNGIKGSVSTTSGVAATLFAVPTEDMATYIVSAGVAAAAPATYSAVSLVSVSGSTARIASLQTAGSLSLGVSGQNVQVTQTSGSAQTVIYSVAKVAQIF